MDVDRLAEMTLDHRRAFDVPAWPAAAPGTVPADHLRRRRLPQHEVGRILLVARHLDPRPGDHRLAVPPAERAVIGVGRDVEEHVPIRLIGMAGGDQRLDHRDHFGDRLGRLRGDLGRTDAERARVGEVEILETAGDHGRLDALGPSGFDDLVVDVGDVAGVDHRCVAIDVAQQPRQQVEHHCRPGIADMGAAVDGGTAQIHRHPLRVGGCEDALLARHRVVKTDFGHAALAVEGRR